MAAQRDPLIGTILGGRFEIVAPIGAGGMGRIYRAIQRPLDRLVALKVLNPRFDGANDPKFEERFFLEALMTAKLKHPNTVTVYDYGRSEDGIYFMALELLEGQTLQQALVKSGPMEWSRALLIGAQVARSLREAHQLGLVHRDLKPANIMLLSEGRLGDRVKVLDFGLVKNVVCATPGAQEEQENLTEVGVVLGSPLYMAPEQARKAIDVRSDVYSLGAVLFAAMAGRTPFLGKKPFDLMVKHMHEKPPQLSAFARVPKAVNALVMKCLEKRTEDRFQNADELLVAIDQALSAQGRGGLLLTRAGSIMFASHANGSVTTQEIGANTPASAGAAPRAAPESAVSSVRSASRRRRPLPRVALWTLALGVASSALGAVLVASRAEGTTGKLPAPVKIVAPISVVAPVKVAADVASETAVLPREKERVDATPVRLSPPMEGQHPPRTRLALVLDGYETGAVEARGRYVSAHQGLARRAEKASTKPLRVRSTKKNSMMAPSPYRSDPYE